MNICSPIDKLTKGEGGTSSKYQHTYFISNNYSSGWIFSCFKRSELYLTTTLKKVYINSNSGVIFFR
jgi:hypothetical protein